MSDAVNPADPAVPAGPVGEPTSTDRAHRSVRRSVGPVRGRRRGWARLVSERGAASVQVAVIVVPALFAVLILALQFTFAWMASQAVQTAAENAADAVSSRNGTEADARAAADRVLANAGYATVTGTEIAIGAESVRVELRARAYQFLPVAWEVTGVAEAPIEDFRSSEERQ